MNLDQFTSQFSQFIFNILEELSRLVDQIFISGIIGNLIAILKSVGQFIILALEALVRVLKFFIK